MPYLPYLDEIELYRDVVSEFGGYNHNLRQGTNEFYDMKNMSSDVYPVLSTRNKRGRLRVFEKPNGLHAHNKLCWVDGTDFYYDGEKKGTVTDSPKQFVNMGSYILVWPDKAFYNTFTDEFGSLENSISTSGEVTYTLSRDDGSAYENVTISDTAPSSPADQMLWIDTGENPNVLKQYSATAGTWVSMPTTYVKISAPGIGNGFAEYDGVSIAGMKEASLNGNFTLYGIGDDFILITGIIAQVGKQTESVTVSRSVPDMDFITESENRIWGCSSKNHEVYACKLGDPKNWNSFLGIASDSYALTIGSSGDFTGCTTHLSNIIFFKEDVIHKVWGTKPSNYELDNVTARGVQKGSEKSIVIVNETLYYKSRTAICTYGSSLPSAVSDALGTGKYFDAAAGSYGNKYYVSMRDEDNEWHLFVFDEEKNLWHREDNTHAVCFASLGPDLYFINEADNGLYTVSGSLERYCAEGASQEDAVEWYVESGDIGITSPDHKYISKLQFRMEVALGSRVCIDLMYDSSGRWEHAFNITASRKQSFTVPVIPRRCDTMKYRICGIGSCKIFTISKITEQGSEV